VRPGRHAALAENGQMAKLPFQVSWQFEVSGRSKSPGHSKSPGRLKSQTTIPSLQAIRSPPAVPSHAKGEGSSWRFIGGLNFKLVKEKLDPCGQQLRVPFRVARVGVQPKRETNDPWQHTGDLQPVVVPERAGCNSSLKVLSPAP
jgi:hypothetical protein